MDHVVPCMQMSTELHVFLAVMNVLQSVVLAMLAQRAVRKNREDKRGNGSG